VIENMVELVGLEATTSSLRILHPVRDDATPKKSDCIERQCWCGFGAYLCAASRATCRPKKSLVEDNLHKIHQSV